MAAKNSKTKKLIVKKNLPNDSRLVSFNDRQFMIDKYNVITYIPYDNRDVLEQLIKAGHAVADKQADRHIQYIVKI